MHRMAASGFVQCTIMVTDKASDDHYKDAPGRCSMLVHNCLPKLATYTRSVIQVTLASKSHQHS